MAFPVLLQRVTLRTDPAPAGSRVVYHSAYPTMVDLLGLAPWPILRSGLQKWTAGSCEVPGCLALAEPGPLTPLPLDSPHAPALALLDELVRSGWEYGKPPLVHALSAAKHFTAKDPIAAKAYLRCLVGLESLLGRGQLAGLRSDQPNGYYACILASGQPDSVPLGLPAIEYQALVSSLLKISSSGQLPGSALPVPAIMDADDDDGPELSFAIPGPVAAAEKLPAPGRRGQQPRVRHPWKDLVHGIGSGQRAAEQQLLPLEDAGADSVAAPAAQALPLEDAGADSVAAPVAQALLLEDASVDSVAAPLAQALPLEDAGEDSVAAPVDQAASRNRKRESGQREAQGSSGPTDMLVEGVVVHREEWGQLGQSDAYRRLFVRCPHCNCVNNAITTRRTAEEQVA